MYFLVFTMVKKKKFEDYIKEHGDCPEEIFDLAKTKWQKAVAVEFFVQNKKMEEMKNDIKWLKRLVTGMFSVTVIALVAEFVLKVLLTSV